MDRFWTFCIRAASIIFLLYAAVKFGSYVSENLNISWGTDYDTSDTPIPTENQSPDTETSSEYALSEGAGEVIEHTEPQTDDSEEPICDPEQDQSESSYVVENSGGE